MPKAKREELARLTGIPATNLSAMNTGSKPMTPAAAQRIVDAVPGVTLLDLGAPEGAAPDPLELDRLGRVEAQADRNRETLERILKALDAAGIDVPAAA